MIELPKSARRVQQAADAANLPIRVTEMPDSTRTAEEAAAACGCMVAQIVKSLVFRGRISGKPVLLLVSGKNRVDQKAVAAHVGEALERPDAAYVRDVTGYAIGGIPPIAHATPLETYIDADLLVFDTVYAAAGTPRCIFAVEPKALARAAGAKVIPVGADGPVNPAA